MVSKKIVRRSVLTVVAGAAIAMFAPGVASASVFYAEGESYAGEGGAGSYSVTSSVDIHGNTCYETTHSHAGPEGAYSTTVNSCSGH